MTSYVFTIKEDVCLANGKTDEKIAELLKLLPTYGDLEDLEKYIATVKAPRDETIANLTAEIEAIKSLKLTRAEFKVVESLRLAVDEATAKKDVEIAERDKIIAAKDRTIADVGKVIAENNAVLAAIVGK